MKRKDFFKRLGLLTGGAIVAPMAVAEALKDKTYPEILKHKPPSWASRYHIHGNLSWAHYEEDWTHTHYAKTGDLILDRNELNGIVTHSNSITYIVTPTDVTVDMGNGAGVDIAVLQGDENYIAFTNAYFEGTGQPR